jgi:hypothetical protein
VPFLLLCTAVKYGAVVAVDAVERALGTWAGSLTAILVALSTLGSANATIMCGGRYLVSKCLVHLHRYKLCLEGDATW